MDKTPGQGALIRSGAVWILDPGSFSRLCLPNVSELFDPRVSGSRTAMAPKIFGYNYDVKFNGAFYYLQKPEFLSFQFWYINRNAPRKSEF